ncbi:FG-GAP-like repeat-containing protein [Streptomyces sp. NPDC008121]|uniref:FG-GAP-like repeat-containing protein n=1 Tax=Streptomyces sp. NPDC008121 TaxID=3364809 RepID=UPI0036EED912
MNDPRRTLRRWTVGLTAVLALLTGTVTGAAADTVDPATAPPVRTLTYNVCGGHTCQSALDLPTWTAELREQTTSWDADAVMLQELCIGQWASLRDALKPDYTAVWTSTTTSNGCAKWSATGDERFGLGVFVKAPAVERYTAALTVPAGKEPRAVLCARGPVDGRTTLACTTHLAQYIQPDNGSAEALAHIDTWAAGVPVILGGDFNAGPAYAALDPVRAGLPGTGRFAEADENDRDHFTRECLDAGAGECESGEATVPAGPKFDHVFFSAGDFHTVRADAFEPQPAGTAPLSDHLLLRAAAHPEPRAGSGVPGDLTGDRRPDVLAVQDEGDLRLYPGTGGGRLGTARQIGTGGWTDAVVSHRGDWTGDGREDVVARIGDALWVYPNTGSGELGARLPMGGRPTGWSHATPVSAGDIDGDGHPDVLARSATGLWLHRGAPAVDGTPGFAARAAVRIGEPEWAGYDVLLPGDADHDGRADVWGRDRATGTIAHFAGRGAQPLATARALDGGPWTVADRRLAVSAGDVNGDGTPDLWTTRTSGTAENLEFLPGTTGTTGTGPATTGLGTPATIGSGGWQWMRSLG